MVPSGSDITRPCLNGMAVRTRRLDLPATSDKFGRANAAGFGGSGVVRGARDSANRVMFIELLRAIRFRHTRAGRAERFSIGPQAPIPT